LEAALLVLAAISTPFQRGPGDAGQPVCSERTNAGARHRGRRAVIRGRGIGTDQITEAVIPTRGVCIATQGLARGFAKATEPLD
jgi:hypothetical protein